MDPSYQSSDESDDGSAAMAAAMGFSNFGAQKPPLKKRKFNAATDAFVEGDELAHIDKGGKKGQGSGGNQVPLGKTRVLGVRSKAVNDEEIDLDGVDDEEEPEDAGNGPRYMDSSLPPPTDNPYWYGSDQGAGTEVEGEEDGPRYMDTSIAPPAEHDDSGDGPAYIDTSLPPPAASTKPETDEAREMQARIDSILSSIQAPPGSESETAPPSSNPSQEPPLSAGLPPKPSFAHAGNSRPGFGDGGGRGRGRGVSDAMSVASGSTRGGRGQHNPEWYLGYYDHSFNENPWERLEKNLGLEPVGSWVQRPPR